MGYLTPLSRLTEIQKDVFSGINLSKKLGIREVDVHAGEYLAPSAKDLPDLLAVCDQQVMNIVSSETFLENYDYAVRASALIYTLLIMCHPLRDGNGQSCLNLICSYLKDANWEKSFFPDYKKGSKLRASALGLLQTKEVPTEDIPDLPTTRDTLELPNKKQKRPNEKERLAKDQKRQKIANDLIRQTTEALWPFFEEYFRTGSVEPNRENLDSTHWGNFKCLIQRVEDANQQLRKSLTGS